MLRCCCLPENSNTCPSPVRNMHFEGPQNMNQMRSPFMEKGDRSFFILSSKGVKHYSIILIILIMIIAPRQLGKHHMHLELHSSAFKIQIFLSIDTSQPPRETPDGIGEPSTGKHILLLFPVK